MPGGLLQITTYQQDGGDFTNNNPQITFFKSVFKRFSNFAIENVQVQFNNNTEPDWEKPTNFMCKLDNIGHLLCNTYLSVDMPQFNQSITNPDLNAQWINDLGIHMIENVQFIIGGETIQEFSSDWINIYYKRYLSYEKYLQQKKLINVDNSPDKKNILNMNTNLYALLPFYFSKDWSLSIPFLNVEYQTIYLNVIIKPIKKWLTIIETNKNSPYYGKRIAPYGDYISTLKKMTSGNFFVSLSVHCGLLENEEFNKLRSSTLHYIIDQHTEIIQTNIIDTNVSININQRLPIKELWILSSRSDIYSRNTWAEYSNLDLIDGMDADLLKPIDYIQSRYTPTDFLKQYWLYYADKGILPTHNIIETISLVLDDQYRFKNLSGAYMALVQPFIHKYHYNNRDYIYNYSFAIHPLQCQPSGFLNMDRINKAQLDIKLSISPPIKPITMATKYSINTSSVRNIPSNKKTIYQPDPNEYQPYNNEKYAYTFTIKVILVHFNILRIKSGMVDIIIKK
jgi:hypothetical protein